MSNQVIFGRKLSATERAAIIGGFFLIFIAAFSHWLERPDAPLPSSGQHAGQKTADAPKIPEQNQFETNEKPAGKGGESANTTLTSKKAEVGRPAMGQAPQTAVDQPSTVEKVEANHGSVAIGPIRAGGDVDLKVNNAPGRISQ